MFFGGKRKKIEALLAAGQEHAAAGNFAEARKAADEAFKLAADKLGEHMTGARQALKLMVHAAVKVGDWAWAESALERGLELFETNGIPDDFTAQVRRSLLELYAQRENHGAVLELVQRRNAQIANEHPEHSMLRALSAMSLVALGRIDDAVQTATQAFETARKHHPNSAATVTCGMQLASVLIETGRDPATGFKLVELFRLKEPPRDVGELVGFLNDSYLQAKAHLVAGNLNETVQFVDVILKMTFEPVWKVGGYARLLSGKLEGLRGEALAALGQFDEAAQKVHSALRDIEIAAGPRSPDLVPILESYARVLRTKNDVRGAESQEKRVAAIRSLVTGKKVAPVKQEASKPVNSVWPRRTLAGVYELKNVSREVLVTVISSMAPVAPDDTGFETIPMPGDQAFIVINQWEKAFQPPIALVAKNYLTALSNILRLVNAGVVAAGGKPVELEAWTAVQDDLQCSWERWPAGQREKLIREVFPRLPDWRGDEVTMRWLGDGVRCENGRPRQVTACLGVAFEPNKVVLSGMGPNAVLDKWFAAFARATQLFAPETFSRFSDEPTDAHALLGKVPTARA